MNKKFLTVQDITLIAVFVALIAVCSWISIPIGPVPFTLQTFAVFVAAGMLGTKRGTIAVLVYILLGAIGIPVFAGFSGSVGIIAGPTGGYIVGFILTAIAIGVITALINPKNETAKIVVFFIAMLIGDALCFAVGTLWFMKATGNGLGISLTYCVTPYIIPDIAKMVIAVILVNRVKKYVKIFNK